MAESRKLEDGERSALRVPRWAAVSTLALISIVATIALIDSRNSFTSTCSAAGYSSTLWVALTGDTSAIAQLQILTGDTWQTPLAGNIAGEPAIPASRVGDIWTFVLSNPEDSVTLRTIDSEGGVLEQTDLSVDWKQASGSGPCGGPRSGSVQWAP